MLACLRYPFGAICYIDRVRNSLLHHNLASKFYSVRVDEPGDHGLSLAVNVVFESLVLVFRLQVRLRAEISDQPLVVDHDGGLLDYRQLYFKYGYRRLYGSGIKEFSKP